MLHRQPGRESPREAEILAAVGSGKRAFGFTVDHIESTVRILMAAILAHHHDQGNDEEEL